MTKDFKDKMSAACEHVKKNFTDNKEKITSEAMTVTTLIEPVIRALGYDTSDPTQYRKEYSSPDKRSTNKGRIDCTLLDNEEQPVIILECKHWDKKLDKHERQLFDYHGSSNARLGILTNGILYRFFADLDKPNIMDKTPFFEFDIRELDDEQIEVFKKFSKSYFNIDHIIETATEMKIIKKTKDVVKSLIHNPPQWFVKSFVHNNIKEIKTCTQAVIEEYTTYIKKAFAQIMLEVGNEYGEKFIQDYMKKNKETLRFDFNDLETFQEEKKSGIETTEEELEGYRIVCEILREHIDLSRVVYRDTINYFGILLDDNNRKPICRLRFNNAKKYIVIFGEDQTLTNQGAKQGTKYEIRSPNDINGIADKLIACVMYYEQQGKPEPQSDGSVSTDGTNE